MFDYFGNSNVVILLANILAWMILISLLIWQYRKLQIKPKFWKIILIALIGMFSFTFDWHIQETLLRIPILPLGVWILVFVFRGKASEWQVYRRFAWLGFLSLFIFILIMLLTIPVKQAIYPEDKPSTYITDVENAAIFRTHPSAEEQSLNKDVLTNQLDRMEQQTIHSSQWYQEMTMDSDTRNIEEKFPYYLTGITPKWGSGIDAILYIEQDGKGLLITAPTGQYYFRFDASLFKEGGNG